MAKGDGNDAPSPGGGGGIGTPSNNSLFTWAGGQPGNPGGNFIGWGETGFKPDEFSKVLGHDLNAAYGQGPKVFNENLFAGLGPESTGLIQAGLAGPMGAAARGDYLSGSNPHFEAALAKTLGDVNTGVSSTFNGSGRFGGLSHQQGLAQSLGDISTQARQANYENEWQRMQAAQAQQLGLSGLLDQNRQGMLTGANDLFRRQNDAAMQHVGNTMNLFGGAMQNEALLPEQRPFANLLGLGAGLFGSIF